MNKLVSIAAVVLTVAAAGAAVAQPREVAGDLKGGLAWAVSAQDGVTWELECGFRPVTIRGIYQNRINTSGTGSKTGRLPTDNGRCTLKKTGGEGNIGLALVKNGTPTASGSTGSQPVVVNIF